MEILSAIMNENTSRFLLAYSSPIFKQSIIQQIGKIGLSHESHNLIINNIPIITEDDAIN